MTSPTDAFDVGPKGRLFTAADLSVLPTSLPSGDVDYELDKGRIIVMVPPGHDHASAQFRLSSALFAQGEDQGHGRGFTEIGILLSRNPDSVVAPDVAFVVASRLPVRQSPEGYLETIPDLVVEIRSKNDTAAEVERKVNDYLAAGVKVVWVAEPASKMIVVHRVDTEPGIYRESDSVAIDDLIPGFRLAVAKIFRQ